MVMGMAMVKDEIEIEIEIVIMKIVENQATLMNTLKKIKNLFKNKKIFLMLYKEKNRFINYDSLNLF